MKLQRHYHSLIPYSYCKADCPERYMDSGPGTAESAAKHARENPGHPVRVVSTSVLIIQTAGTLAVTDA